MLILNRFGATACINFVLIKMFNGMKSEFFFRRGLWLELDDQVWLACHATRTFAENLDLGANNIPDK